ncbi:MAG: hypothetical protein FWF81_08185 [Defluviitaleaceae bacterium]|nr:hypothetical protein [Defluviitaleaceae bacterium]
MTRRMFAGGLTPVGFVDYFEYIMPIGIARKRYFLKGASGSGKSTFIKKIAAKFEDASADIDLFHCANDASGLDGIAVKEFGFAIIDATMPHSHDPEIPAAVDKIIDFAEFLDSKKIYKHVDEIKKLMASKKNMYSNAQKFLTAAGSIYSADNKFHENALIKTRIQNMAREHLWHYKNRLGLCVGTDRKLFLSAITPTGIVNFSDKILGKYTVFGINSEAGFAADAFLTELKNYANACAINTESFFSPLEPTLRDYLILPEEGLAFAKVGGLFGYSGEPNEKIDLGNYAFHNPKITNKLLNAAISSMKNATDIHKKIEEIYIDKMDFDKVNDLTNKILAEALRPPHFGGGVVHKDGL